MQARDVMTRKVITVQERDTVRRSAELMSTNSITSLPVLDEDYHVVGIVSEADLIRDRMPSDPRSHLRREAHPEPDPSRRVFEVMTKTVVCLAPGADTADLAAVMLDNNVRAIPIVDGAHLVGIVTGLARTVPGVLRVHTHNRRWH